MLLRCFFFQAEDGIRDGHVTGVQTCALPISLAVLAFADQWRSFVWPLVATRSSEMQPLEVGIANLRGMYDLSWSDQMATAAAAVIPLMVLYFVAQRYFIRGIEQTVV